MWLRLSHEVCLSWYINVSKQQVMTNWAITLLRKTASEQLPRNLNQSTLSEKRTSAEPGVIKMRTHCRQDYNAIPIQTGLKMSGQFDDFTSSAVIPCHASRHLPKSHLWHIFDSQLLSLITGLPAYHFIEVSRHSHAVLTPLHQG